MGEGARRAGEGDRSSEKTHQTVTPRSRNLARKLRRNSTEAERLFWELLRDRRLSSFKFRRQVPIGPYIADFCCYGAMLIVELDGSQHAENARDALRDAELKRRGFRTLRIWNSDLTDNRDGVLDAVWHALHQETVQ